MIPIRRYNRKRVHFILCTLSVSSLCSASHLHSRVEECASQRSSSEMNTASFSLPHTPSEKIKDLGRGKWHLTLDGILSDITGTTDPTHRVERFRGPCGKEPRENVWRGKPLSNTDNCMWDFKRGLEGSGPIRFPPEPVEQVGNSQMFPKAESVFSVALHSSGIYFTNCLCATQAHMLQTTAYYV